MKQAYTNPSLAICLYGTNKDSGVELKQLLDKQFTEFNISYFESYDDADHYKNLWLSSFKKRQRELEIDTDFDACLAIDVTDIELAQLLKSDFYTVLQPYKLNDIQHHVVYFLKGAFYPVRVSTAISTSGFYADSVTFDLACNFNTLAGKLSANTKAITCEEEFYYFLKTLKIKTECINYENSSLFKWTT